MIPTVLTLTVSVCMREKHMSPTTRESVGVTWIALVGSKNMCGSAITWMDLLTEACRASATLELAT